MSNDAEKLGMMLGELWRAFLADTTHWERHDIREFLMWCAQIGEE